MIKQRKGGREGGSVPLPRKKATKQLLPEAGDLKLLDRQTFQDKQNQRLRPNVFVSSVCDFSLKRGYKGGRRNFALVLTSEVGTKNKTGTSDALSVATKFCEVPGDSPPSVPASTFTTLRHCPWACLQCYCLLLPLRKITIWRGFLLRRQHLRL